MMVPRGDPIAYVPQDPVEVGVSIWSLRGHRNGQAPKLCRWFHPQHRENPLSPRVDGHVAPLLSRLTPIHDVAALFRL